MIKVWADNCITILNAVKLGVKQMPNSYYLYMNYVRGDFEIEDGPGASKLFEDQYLNYPLTKEDFKKNWIHMQDIEDPYARIEQLERQLENAVVALCHKRKREEDQD
ncbi:hypothetical protein SAMD00019534_091690, partial [Acytostelium subglobosum LB1]|uniref:hypothetical protein n=1 Tax=Acytostelium subglobosum LB1 TaxID=1410327 RepID=UPI000644BE64